MQAKSEATNINGCRLMAGIFLSIGAASTHGDMINSDELPAWEICAMCHGLDGSSHMSKFPKLAGQKPEYIVEQIKQFANGHRSNDGGQMQSIVTEIDPSEIPKVAEYFSSQTPKPSGEYSPENGYRAQHALFKKGKKLFWGGGAMQVACAQCHADAETKAPWLHGQHQNYLSKQINDFKTGARSVGDEAGNTKNWKAKSLKKINEHDVQAITFYLSNGDLNAVKNAVKTGGFENE